jgi:hypothetical protein
MDGFVSCLLCFFPGIMKDIDFITAILGVIKYFFMRPLYMLWLKILAILAIMKLSADANKENQQKAVNNGRVLRGGEKLVAGRGSGSGRGRGGRGRGGGFGG